MKQVIFTVLFSLCIIGMSACSFRAEGGPAPPYSSDEYRETDAPSGPGVGGPSAGGDPEPAEPAAEPNDPAAGPVQPVSILPAVPAEAQPVALTITVSNPIASEVTIITDGQKAAEFASQLQQVIPVEGALPEDVETAGIVLRYSLDGGEHSYRYYRENGVDHIAVNGELYRMGDEAGRWISELIPELPAAPAGIDEDWLAGQEYAVIKRASLTGSGTRVIWQVDQLERIKALIEDAERLETDLIPDTGGDAVEVTFQNAEHTDPYIFIPRQENGFGLMKQGANWFYVDERAYDHIVNLLGYDA